jgi:hypothetical protein
VAEADTPEVAEADAPEVAAGRRDATISASEGALAATVVNGRTSCLRVPPGLRSDAVVRLEDEAGKTGSNTRRRTANPAINGDPEPAEVGETGMTLKLTRD